MKLVWLVLVLCGCGSVFIEAPPPPPDFNTCNTLVKEIQTNSPGTLLPLPFDGSRKVTVFTKKPEGWDQFSGSLHLQDIEWNIDWIKSGYIAVGSITIASLEDSEWTTYNTLDLYPFLTEQGNWLKFEALLKAKGWKPGPKQLITANVTVSLCGEGSESVHNDGI